MPRKNGNTTRSRKSSSKQRYDDREDLEYMPDYKTGSVKKRIRNKLTYKNEAQKVVVEEVLRKNVLSFVGGPAGTAKTYLAVAEALRALEEGEVQKIVVARPTVMAGGEFGHLPGEIKDKMDPFVRPIYDCIEHLTLDTEAADELIEGKKLEILPFQFMRGRTLTDCYIILDETQNATEEQFKMAVTRIGFGSKMVVTFDEAQIDLKREKSCADLIHTFDKDPEDENSVRNRRRNNIGFYKFSKKDICRAPIVGQVLDIFNERGV